MHRHLHGHVLRLIHAVIFLTLLLRDWCSRTLVAALATAASIAQHLRLVRHLPSQQPRQLRGKQPRPPRTVAVVLADDCSSIEPVDKLAAVLAWCLTQNIPSLLVYHPQGIGAGQLHHLSELLSSSFCSIALQAGFDESQSGCPADAVNGCSNRRARVQFLDAKDAEWPLVRAACNIEQQQDTISDAQLHPAEALRSQVARAAGDTAATEADIVLVFGKAFTLAGFPPWLLRFGELYHLGQLSEVTDELLQTTLQKYSNVAQRFGT